MFKSAATKFAHNSTIPAFGGNKDLKPLQDLITAEKSVLTSYDPIVSLWRVTFTDCIFGLLFVVIQATEAERRPR